MNEFTLNQIIQTVKTIAITVWDCSPVEFLTAAIVVMAILLRWILQWILQWIAPIMPIQ